MKILVFADVHGNLNALKALVETEDFKTADKCIFLGDVVTGCSRPNECIDLLTSLNCECLLGNNDFYVCDHIPQEEYDCSSPVKIEQMKYFQNVVTNKNKKRVLGWKKDLTIKLGNKSFYFTHYPWESDENVVDSPSENSHQTYSKIFENVEADYIFIGHEHKHKNLVVGNKKLYLVGTLGIKSPGHYVVLNVQKDDVRVENKFVDFDINHEIDLMDKIGYPYDKDKIKKKK